MLWLIFWWIIFEIIKKKTNEWFIHVLACDCNPEGSATQQCNQTTGHCNCMLGIGGEKCDTCARGYLGTAPNCSPCGECFENWDQTQKALSGKINLI